LSAFKVLRCVDGGRGSLIDDRRETGCPPPVPERRAADSRG
jgi:hypothetical protein